MVTSYTQEEQVWQKSHLRASQEAGQCYNTSKQRLELDNLAGTRALGHNKSVLTNVAEDSVAKLRAPEGSRCSKRQKITMRNARFLLLWENVLVHCKDLSLILA